MRSALLKIITDTPLRRRHEFDEALASLAPEDLPILWALDSRGRLKGDWRRSAVRSRIVELEHEYAAAPSA